MKMNRRIKLAIFDRYKTEDRLTCGAKRQRTIIMIIATSSNPNDRTRSGISQVFGKQYKVVWKNVYSGIFREMDKILIPMGFVEEDGRLPLKRGPKALQEKGVPFYHLTKKGLLVALAITDTEHMEMLFDEFITKLEPEERRFEPILTVLIKNSPRFAHNIFMKYVKTCCLKNVEDLLPFDLTKLGETKDEYLDVQKETLDAFLTLGSKNKKDMIKLLNIITN